MFETSLLFILVLHTFRVHYITNQLLMAFVAFNLFILIYFAITNSVLNNYNYRFLKIILFFLIVLSIFGFITFRNFEERKGIGSADRDLAIHDGLLQTEFASMQLLQGKNPYSITYERVLRGERYYPNGVEHPSLSHYVYSPLMFLINIPFSIISMMLGVLDLRISLIFFYIITGFIGSLIVKEKMLFLTIFYLNPFFVPMLLFGAGDVILMAFLYLCILFLKIRRFGLATLALGLATGTKLLALPFVPLYLIYLYYWSSNEKNRKKVISKQLFIFLLVNFIIYFPFAVWNIKDFMEDLVIYPYMVSSGYEISGFIGLPRFLISVGLVSKNLGLLSNFTLITFVILTVIVLFFSVNIIKKSNKIGTLLFLCSLFFIVILSLSRLFQPNYLSFISQIMLLW